MQILRAHIGDKWRYFTVKQIIKRWNKGKWEDYVQVLLPEGKKVKILKSEIISTEMESK